MNIIAECGVNYTNIEEAQEMINRCADLNIKLVKFQLWKKDQVPKEVQCSYLDKEDAELLHAHGQFRGLEVFFTPFYPGAIDICESIGVKFYKVKFQDRNNLTLYRRLKKVARDKIIFVSCQYPLDTIYWNLARYQKNVKFLYCVPKYPASCKDYILINECNGFSDHTPDLKLYNVAKSANIYDWFEMHVKNDDDCYESDWSKNFEQLKEVLD